MDSRCSTTTICNNLFILDVVDNGLGHAENVVVHSGGAAGPHGWLLIETTHPAPQVTLNLAGSTSSKFPKFGEENVARPSDNNDQALKPKHKYVRKSYSFEGGVQLRGALGVASPPKQKRKYTRRQGSVHASTNADIFTTREEIVMTGDVVHTECDNAIVMAIMLSQGGGRGRGGQGQGRGGQGLGRGLQRGSQGHDTTSTSMRVLKTRTPNLSYRLELLHSKWLRGQARVNFLAFVSCCAICCGVGK